MTSKKLLSIFIVIFIIVGTSTYLFLWKKEIDEMREKNLADNIKEEEKILAEITKEKEKRNIREELDSLIEDVKKLHCEYKHNIALSNLSLYRATFLKLGSHQVKILPFRERVKRIIRPLKYNGLMRVDTAHGQYGKIWIKKKTQKKITFVGKTYKNNFLVDVSLEIQ